MPTVRGKAEVKRYMAQAPKQLETILRGAARVGGKVISDEIALRTPSDDVREGLRTRVQTDGGRIVTRIDLKPGWARSVGIWMEYGTSPHFITVDDSQRGGRSVARINRLTKDADGNHSLVIGGKFVGTTVFHPGASAHPAFRPALDTKEGEALAAAQTYINSRVAKMKTTGLSVAEEPSE